MANLCMAGETAHSDTALSRGQHSDCCSAFGNVISAWHLQGNSLTCKGHP